MDLILSFVMHGKNLRNHIELMWLEKPNDQSVTAEANYEMTM